MSQRSPRRPLRFNALLPFTPIIGVLIFDGKWGPQLHIITILVICIVLAAVLEFVRGFNTQNVFSGLEVAWRGMADAFASVVMLLVAAGVFAPGTKHDWLYSKPDLYRHLFWLRQYYFDAGISYFNYAGRNDHRFR
ncbi:C4-dicarboxylate transporter DcuC [Salmonella bongori]|nr:C4-dicarboxylate transporter DcuC [Salmonella bongori]